MIRIIVLPILTAALVLVATAHAQQSPAYGPYGASPARMGRQEADAIANYWIRSYLRRAATPREVRDWGDRLVSAASPAEVLSVLIAGREYYEYAGGTPEGFIRQLIADVGHHDPGAREIRDRLAATRGLSPREIARRFLREYPANWWPGPEATPPRELQGFYAPPAVGR